MPKFVLVNCTKLETLQDTIEAARLFRLAADDRNPRGPVELGLCYRDGIGVYENGEKVVQLSRAAADDGDIAGLFYLRKCYQN